MRAEANQRIDRELQDWYRSMLDQPVPDRLVAVVAGLDATPRREKPVRLSRRVKRAKTETVGACSGLVAFRPKRALAASAVAP
jgi:hypothetical protein